MKTLAQRLEVYIETHPFDSGDSDCEHKAFLDGLQYGAHLMSELFQKES